MPKALCVLIVEDSEDDALLIVRMLQRGGYEVNSERVDTAAAMRAAVARHHWDVVISDYAMPQFSGLAALQVLHASGLDLPFIIVSGAIGEDMAAEAMRRGAHDYLMKDKLTRLVPAVQRELREAEMRRQRRQAKERLRQAHAELEERVEQRTAELARANGELRREIAERQRAEQELKLAKEAAEAASAAKDQFLGVVSHELRNPLTAVLLMSSLLAKRQDLPADVHEDITSIRRDVELEARIIDDLLDVTRIARGKLKFEFQTTDLHLLICQAADICSFGDGAAIQLQLEAKAHFVQGDPARLQQIFWNLLSNARKFSPAHGHIQVRSANEPDGTIRVEVTDTGLGVEPEFLPRIFMAFEQASSGRSRQFGGLGLGLAISKAIADAHHATLSAYSAGKGCGATFTFAMPAMASSRCKAPGRPAHAPGPCQPPLRILLVDDHRSTLAALARAIQDCGHVLQTATTVQAALYAAESEQFDLLVSDLGLPDGNGHDLMRELRKRYGLKGIALTGHGREADICESKEAGFAEHLIKPVNSAALAEAIHRVAGAEAEPDATSAESMPGATRQQHAPRGPKAKPAKEGPNSRKRRTAAAPAQRHTRQ